MVRVQLGEMNMEDGFIDTSDSELEEIWLDKDNSKYSKTFIESVHQEILNRGLKFPINSERATKNSFVKNEYSKLFIAKDMKLPYAIKFGYTKTLLFFSGEITIYDQGVSYHKRVFLSEKNIDVSWKEITKITVFNGVISYISLYYPKMQPYTPLQISMSGYFFPLKKPYQLLEFIISQAPQAELGMGVEEFRNKYKQKLNETN
jgi:hypothetical protein